jgi:hypothetical protein
VSPLGDGIYGCCRVVREIWLLPCFYLPPHYKNNEICFCCNNKQETVKYLFIECNHTKIKELRDSLPHYYCHPLYVRLDIVFVDNSISTQPDNIEEDLANWTSPSE